MGDEEDAAVQKLLKNPPPAFKLVTERLFKVLTNIVQHPDDPKFRELRCDSATFSQSIASCAGGKAFLRAAGFTEEANIMRLPSPPDVEAVKKSRNVLKAAVKRYAELTQQQQHRENEDAAKKLADLKELSRKRQAQVGASVQAEREEILRGVQIDRDDWQRQRDQTCLK